MTTIIRGGQTTLHYIRMFRQVVKSLFKIGISVIISFVAYNLYQSPLINLVTIYLLKNKLPTKQSLNSFQYIYFLFFSGFNNRKQNRVSLSPFHRTITS